MLASSRVSPAMRPQPGAATRSAALEVVLGRTSRGETQLEQPKLRLSAAQQLLLGSVDGRRSLQLLLARHPVLSATQVACDAARLLAFGLVRQVQGELPRDLVVQAMNLTMQLPLRSVPAIGLPSLVEVLDNDRPPEHWPELEPDEWGDDEAGSAVPRPVRPPELLQALPYMAAASGLTLALAWAVWG